MPRTKKDHSYQKVVSALSTTSTQKTVISSSPESADSLESGAVRRLGWSVVESNLRLAGHGAAVISEVRAQYRLLFDLRSSGSMRLNLRREVDPASFDLLGRAYEDCLQASGRRRNSGGYYSHPEIVGYMVDSLGLENDDRLARRKFIDIACGTGIFLVSALRRTIEVLRSRGLSDESIVAAVPKLFFGLDVNPIACEIARINLYLALLGSLGPQKVAAAGTIPLNVFRTDAIENREGFTDLATLPIKQLTGPFRGGFDYILGNPPFLEAKRMPRHIKESCEANYPELRGAFDLYMAFMCQCNRLASRLGKVHLILPDKFTVARYAREMRERMLAGMTLLRLADLSEIGVFRKARVYPVLLCYQNRPPADGHEVATRISVSQATELLSSGMTVPVPQAFYREVGTMSTLFCMPASPGLADTFRRLFREGAPIGNYLTFRAAITFHQKGLREWYVSQDFASSSGGIRFKYLGGRSYTRRNEVELLGFNWQGYYIDYDQEALARFHNKLPPIGNFARQKIVFCQHARRITAAYDEQGEYVSKDVYPVAFAGPGLAGSSYSVPFFTGLLNSAVMSFVYNTLYKGVQISGGYYHYLPSWIGVLPVIAPEKEDICSIERLVRRGMSEPEPEVKARLMEEVDQIVFDTYMIPDSQRAFIEKSVPPWPGRATEDRAR